MIWFFFFKYIVLCIFCYLFYKNLVNFKRVRGILGGFMAVMQYGGIWTGYIIGAITPYNIIPFIMIPFPIIFLISFLVCVPETPYFLLKMKKRQVNTLFSAFTHKVIKALEKLLSIFIGCRRIYSFL